jgi:hypothetical protein
MHSGVESSLRQEFLNLSNQESLLEQDAIYFLHNQLKV